MWTPQAVKEAVQPYIDQGVVPKQSPVRFKYEKKVYYFYLVKSEPRYEYLVFDQDGKEVEGDSKDFIIRCFVTKKPNFFIVIPAFLLGSLLAIVFYAILLDIQEETYAINGELFAFHRPSFMFFSIFISLIFTGFLFVYLNPRNWKLLYWESYKGLAYFLLICLVVVLPFSILAFDHFEMITSEEIVYSDYWGLIDRHSLKWSAVKEAHLFLYRKYGEVRLNIMLSDGRLILLGEVSDMDTSQDVQPFLRCLAFLKEKNIPVVIGQLDSFERKTIKNFAPEIQHLFGVK